MDKRYSTEMVVEPATLQYIAELKKVVSEQFEAQMASGFKQWFTVEMNKTSENNRLSMTITCSEDAPEYIKKRFMQAIENHRK